MILGLTWGLFSPIIFYCTRPSSRPITPSHWRAYNRWLVDAWLGEDNGLLGVIRAPHLDPTAAVEEIRRYAGHRNMVGVYLPTSCVEPFYGHRRFDPVYEAAQETDVLVMFHSVTALHPVFRSICKATKVCFVRTSWCTLSPSLPTWSASWRPASLCVSLT